jgi:1-acyl-sn-glycerol-3-phosphate acyltransferase
MTARAGELVHSAAAWAVAVSLALVMTPAGLVLLPLARDPEAFALSWVRAWCRAVLAVCRLSVEVEDHGRERLRAALSAGPVVLACNHQSILDIAVLITSVPGDFGFVARREIFALPLVGFVMRRIGTIALDRAAPGDPMKALSAARDALARGRTVLIFPEGTRTADGALGTFRRGAALLALSRSVPIVPVVIDGTFAILPRRAVTGRPGPIRLRVGEPIRPETGSAPESGPAAELSERLQSAVAALLAAGPARQAHA